VNGGQLQSLLDETERELAAAQRKFASRPAQERAHLWMVGLEREQVATTSYRTESVGRRIAGLRADDEVRELLTHAFRWAEKDEELHTTYLRGILLERQSGLDTFRAYGHQMAGAVGGWLSVSRQYNSQQVGAFRRSLATALLLGGVAAGKVSVPVRRGLVAGTFPEFCSFNAALERTAERCYRRLVELKTDDKQRVAFARIADDENRHAALLEVFADAFDESDALKVDWNADRLTAAVGSIAEWYLPSHRRVAPTRSTFGAPADVLVHVGAPDDMVALRNAVRASCDATIPMRAGASVVIKATFMFGYHRDDTTSIVDPEVLRCMIEWLREQGAADIMLLDAPTLYTHFFQNRSVDDVAAYFELDRLGVKIIDSSTDQVNAGHERGLGQESASASWLTADVRIVVGKLRTNPSEFVNAALSTLEGLGELQENMLFPDRKVRFRDSTAMLLDTHPPHAAFVDAWQSAAQGCFGTLGCRRPAHPGRLYASTDALAVDVVLFGHCGLADPTKAPGTRTLAQWFGVDLIQYRPAVLGCDEPIIGFNHPWKGPVRRFLSWLAYPMYIGLSSHGELFTPAVDVHAFPPRGRPRLYLRVIRRSAQLAFGVRPPTDPWFRHPTRPFRASKGSGMSGLEGEHPSVG
jgi:uncharacterized protein (DUF362 family)